MPPPDSSPHPARSATVLGVDFGERRIGLAVSDPAGRMAVPLATVERSNDRQAIAEILALVERETVGALVVGEPLALDGARGAAAHRARRFGERLGRAARLPVVMIDEALTSVAAEERLREAGVDVGRHPGRVDALAAQILLQDALDRGLTAVAAER